MKLAFIEFGTVITLGDTAPEQQLEMPLEAWLAGQVPVAGATNLLSRLTKDGWTTYLSLPFRTQTDKVAIQDWLGSQDIAYKKLDLPRNVSANFNAERWLISRLHDIAEFDEPQRIAALLMPDTLKNLNKQMSGALMDWQPKSLVSATTVEQAVTRFLETKRSLPMMR